MAFAKKLMRNAERLNGGPLKKLERNLLMRTIFYNLKDLFHAIPLEWDFLPLWDPYELMPGQKIPTHRRTV